MKKRIRVLLLGVVMLLLCGKVNASASLVINCDKTTLNEGGSTTCTVKVNSTESSISAVNFDINTDFLTVTESDSPGCSSIYDDRGGGYQCSKSYNNGDTVLTMTLAAPKKFYNTNYTLKTTGVTILNGGSTKVQTASSYSYNLNIKGSLPSTGKSASLNLECDDTATVGAVVKCQLVLDLKACYYTSISFSYNKTEIDSFTYDEDAFSTVGNSSSGNTVIVSLGNSITPFVGRTVVGEIKFTMTSASKSISLKNIRLSTNEVGYANGIMTNISHETKKLDDIFFDYNISVKSAKLSSLKVNNEEIKDFDSDQYTYVLAISAIDDGSGKINILGVAEDPTATVSGNGIFQLKEGENVYKITCTNPQSADGVAKREYTINVTYVDNRSTDNTLKSLIISGSGVDLNFNPNTTNYSIEVEGTLSKTTVVSSLNDPKATYVSGYGNRNINLAYGSNTILIKVKSEKGVIREYKIVVNRKDNRSTDNTLKSLSVNGGEINLKPDTTTYTIDVGQDVKTAKITSELSNSKASYVKDFGNRTVDLKFGANTILVKVKAENEKVNEYKIVINRKDERSTINTLKSLDIDGYITNFKPETKEYSFEVENSVSKVTIKSELSDSKASYVKNFGDRMVFLNEGNNEILIKVQAENEKVNEYKIKVFREYNPEHLKNNTSIKALKIGDTILESDEDGKYIYNSKGDTDKLDINVLLTNSNGKYEIVGNSDIKDGSEIKVVVTSEDKKEQKEYLIEVKVVKQEENNKQEEVKTVGEEEKYTTNMFIIGIVALVALFVIGLIASKKKKAPVVTSETVNEITVNNTQEVNNTDQNNNIS